MFCIYSIFITGSWLHVPDKLGGQSLILLLMDMRENFLAG